MKSLATINPNVQQPYKPEELDPGTQQAIESLQENIDKKQKELDRLNNFQEYSSLKKLSYEKRQSLIKQAEFAIADWNEEIRQMTATSAENLEWEAKAVSGKDIEVDPVLAEAARRKERQLQARQRVAEKKLKAEQTTAKAPKVTKVVPNKTFEVSTKGDDLGKQFSALNATFKEGPYAGRTIEDVWQNEIKKSGKGRPPAEDSILFGKDYQVSKDEYQKLWQRWADENPELINQLKAKVDEGYNLVDSFAGDPNKTVNQAEALTNVLNNQKSGTVYNTIENPRGLNHYVNRTLYNYANSDITFDFTATEGPSGGGNSAGKGTPDFMKKWTNVAVDNAGKLTASNIDEIAQKLADALTSGQTVNIAGHGNYESIRGGFSKAVWQSQVDGTMQTIFDKAIELAGDKPITGKVISGGQSGFDEAGIRTARNLGIPTEVNVTEYTWRDASGEHYNDEQGFKDRVNADSYDSETFQGKTPEIKTVGWIDELADNEIFVFGSNQKGIHGKGAALDAKNKFGAVQGVGEGLTGQSYALPTKSTPYQSLTIDEVSKNLDTFLEVAKNNPDKTFKMSAIGTNLAEFKPQEIADILFSKDIPSNVHVPESLFKLKSDTKFGPGAADPNDPAFKAISEVEAKSNTPGFGRYAIYLIDPISELIEDGAIALAAKMGFPKVAQGLMYLMYYEAANLVSGILDATPQAANQAALAQMDQSMILAAGIGMVDEEQYASWKEDLNNATVENIEKAMKDVEQMGSRSPLSHVWMWAEEKTGAKFSPWQWGWVQDIMGSVGNQMAKLGNHEY